MPSWQPNWDDVVFDHAAAGAAIGQCDLAAGALDTAQTGFGPSRSALDADGQWTGAYRAQYDQAAPRVSDEATSTQYALRRLSRDIADAAAAARKEQAFRESERVRWQTEKAAEDEHRRLRNGNLPD